MPQLKPSFLITIDTEGDNLWSRPCSITTQNAKYLPRFQALCERYGLKPTYLTNYEMAIDKSFIDFGKYILASGTGEIGMHLHAWNSPPILPLTDDDFRYQPFLIEYPADIARQKIEFITELLETTFGIKMISHRAGRWALDAAYAQALVEEGYRIDCSVTPFVTWRFSKGDPRQQGGPDYLDFTTAPYFVDPADIRKPGESPLLEVPVSIAPRIPLAVAEHIIPSLIRAGGRFGWLLQRALAPRWLRPNGRNLKSMLRFLDDAADVGQGYVEFMLHSSELMPGGSPTFRTSDEIDRLYLHMEALFGKAAKHFRGITLAEFRAAFVQGDASADDPSAGEESRDAGTNGQLGAPRTAWGDHRLVAT